MRQPIIEAREANKHGALPIDIACAWRLVRTLADRARGGAPLRDSAGFVARGDHWQEVAPAEGDLSIEADKASVVWMRDASAEARALLELFTPVVVGERAATLVLGHLGQSLDGRVATPTGVSQFITGQEDVVHTHRLRALFDAVIVGVRTVLLDNPQLTTRLVPGAHPTRVILDPRGKLDDGYKVLEDGAACTLVCTASERVPEERRRGHVEWIGLACRDGLFELAELLATLRARGLRRVFIEGGGVTVSRFLAGRVLDRLHVGIAPMILGSGAPGFALPPIDRLDEALTPRCRHFALGNDVLFDCDLSPPARAAE